MSRSNRYRTHLIQNIIKRKSSLYTDSKAIYSLSDFELGVVTNVIRVRRSSDDLEQDFTSIQINQPASTTGSLLDFCGVGDGLITVWYDQKGIYNAIQNNLSKQPKIVNSGSLILVNGKPSVLFEGSQDLATTSNLFNNTYLSIFSVRKFDELQPSPQDIISQNFNLSTNSGGWKYGMNGSASGVNQFFVSKDTSYDLLTNGILTTKINELHSVITSTNTGSIYINSVEIVTETGNSQTGNDNSVLHIGSRNGSTSFFTGKIQEIVLYNEGKSTTRFNIENDINNFYNIF